METIQKEYTQPIEISVRWGKKAEDYIKIRAISMKEARGMLEEFRTQFKDTILGIKDMVVE